MVKCSYCGNVAVMVSSLEFYGRDYGSNIYKCDPCKAYVGTHKGTDKPLGTLANKELRDLRIKCHSLIDPYWRKGKYSRSEVYKRLSKHFNLPKNKTHIGMFDESQCKELIKLLER